jgi:cytochrome P450 family 6
MQFVRSQQNQHKNLKKVFFFLPFRYTFMGFGQGPRSCIAMRFALLEAKVALSSVVRQFDLNVCSKTVDKIELDPKSTLGGNIGGLWVKAASREI